MAEHPDKRLHVRADTNGGWHSQIPDDSIFESTFGQLSYSQSHHLLSAENYSSEQQNAVGYPVSTNLKIPTPLHFYHPMRWPQNTWSDTYENSSSDSAHGGFGSGLEPTELEARYGAANNSYTEAFKYQLALGQAEPSAFDLRSPISDFSGPINPSFFRPNTADFESYLSFHAPIAPVYGNFTTASSRSVADCSPRAYYGASPYTGSSRSRTHSDGLLAIYGAQHQSRLLNSTIKMPAPASHSSQSPGSPELRPSTATTDSESQPTIFSDSDFDSSSFDFAMAFAEASYSAQTSKDIPIPAPGEYFRPATQLNNSPSSHHETSPPDLFAPLRVPPLTPPLSDQARSQSLRSPDDLYTPKFIRNHGIEREGWCGICRPGRWLVLKNSAFWYDKSFMHGIAAIGTRYEEPVEVRRTTGKMDGEGEGRGVGQGDGWEGLCGTCGVWVTLAGGKRGGVPWFRHAYKCHTHHKLQDTPKKRRESKGEKRSKTVIV